MVAGFWQDEKGTETFRHGGAISFRMRNVWTQGE